MSAQVLAAAAGILVSLVFSYLPGVADWYALLDGTQKRLVMLAALLIIACGAIGLSCLGIAQAAGTPLPACTPQGLQTLLEALVAALVANQAAYLISPDRSRREAADPGVNPAPGSN